MRAYCEKCDPPPGVNVTERERPSPSVQTRSWEELALSRSGLPPVVSISVLARYRELDFSNVLGYRLVEKQLLERSDLYARPYLRWKWMCMKISFTDSFWGQMVRLSDRGLIHFTVEEGVELHPRHIRLGRG